MMHNVLLSLLNATSDEFILEELANSPALAKFIHPGEKKILEEIVKIAKKHREIAKFVKNCKYIMKAAPSSTPLAEGGQLQKGLYLQAFASGLDDVLENYVQDIFDLEQRYLRNTNLSLLFVLNKVHKYDLLFSFLQNLIRGISTRHYHGCNIMNYMHQHLLHGNAFISAAAQKIQAFINVTFLKQLTHWLFYGKLFDSYGEFFIQCSDARNQPTTERVGSGASARNAATSFSETTSNFAEIWRYEVLYDFLPNCFSASWAEKVLFIGQTVLMFKTDLTKGNKSIKIWNESEKDKHERSLWNDKEHFYFKKIHELQKDEYINVFKYENIIDDIKGYVTERLSKIAIDQADLVKQLKLIKDFYLLGRGELYLEFIKRTNTLDHTPINENTVRNIVTAFECSATSVNISDDLERFTMTVPKENLIADEPFDSFRYIQLIQLQYKISWPLHLLFSPKVIERYNELLRFLLIIKKTQYDLHMVWYYRRTEKNIETLMLRNQLMFLIDNLQYYIQADVLESQFSIFMNTVLNSTDFENIQRAHSVFQANILSLCFLLPMEELDDSSAIDVTQKPVLEILYKILRLCEAFCKLMGSKDKSLSSSEMKEFDLLKNEFGLLIKTLFSLLNDLKAAPSATPLSQLLIRLDFNHWFSKTTEVDTDN